MITKWVSPVVIAHTPTWTRDKTTQSYIVPYPVYSVQMHQEAKTWEDKARQSKQTTVQQNSIAMTIRGAPGTCTEMYQKSVEICDQVRLG